MPTRKQLHDRWASDFEFKRMASPTYQDKQYEALDARMARAIKDNLVKARLHRFFTQEQLATAIELPIEVVQAFESGTGKCTFCYIRKVSKALDLPVDYFFAGL